METVTFLDLVFAGVTAVASILAAFGVIIAVRVLRLNAWTEAQRIFVNDDFRAARKEMFKHFGFTDPIPSRIGQEDENQGLLVCQQMDELCHLAPYVGKKRILVVFGVQLGKLWMVLRATVKEEQNNWQPGKWLAFECLGEKARKKYSLSQMNARMAREKQWQPTP